MIRHALLFALASPLALSGCIQEDEAEPGPDAAVQADGGGTPDGAVTPDGGVDPDAVVDPDAGGVDAGPAACEGPNPAEVGGCADDADCAEGDLCVADPGACVPSACVCEAGAWTCTSDCGPGSMCVPQGEACGGEICADGGVCVNDRCVGLGAPCSSDFDCRDSYCHEDIGVCVVGCDDEPSEVWCDGLPPLCAIGEQVVARDGCFTCVDARACEALPGTACWGAWLDENGACRAPHDGGYPDGCCTLAGQPIQHGTVSAACGPDDGPAVEYRFGLGTLGCEDELSPGLRIVLWTDAPPMDTLIDISDDTFGGMVLRCDGVECEPAQAGQLYLYSQPEWETSGRFWFTFPDGSAAQSAFSVERCAAELMCG